MALSRPAVPADPLSCTCTAGCPSGQRERSVKPSAQPTLVRIQHLPHVQSPVQRACPRTRRALGPRISQSVDLCVLFACQTLVFPPALVDEVIDQAGVRERRRRLLPARLVVYFTLACWLFRGQGYDPVLRALVAGLREVGPGWGNWTVPRTASISKARDRLGPEVMRVLFGRVAGPVGRPGRPGVFWRGLRLTALDDTTLDVADSTDNAAAFGRPGNAAGGGATRRSGWWPSPNAAPGRSSTPPSGPTAPASRLWPVTCWRARGRGCWCSPIATSPAGGCGSRPRPPARSGWGGPAPPSSRRCALLDDGTYLSELRPPRRRDGPSLPVRVVDYSVGGDDGCSELFCLLTTPLDPASAPALELAELYAERWQIETALKELKVGQRGAGVLLRSHHPDGVRQEIWAMLCVYQAARPDIPGGRPRRPRPRPNQLQQRSRRRPPLHRDGDFPSGGSIKQACDHLFADLTRRPVPTRPGRTSPRAVKRRSSSRYPSRGDQPAVRLVHRHIVLHQLTPRSTAAERCGIGQGQSLKRPQSGRRSEPKHLPSPRGNEPRTPPPTEQDQDTSIYQQFQHLSAG